MTVANQSKEIKFSKAELDLVKLEARIVNLESRCTEKEKDVKDLTAWQNKAIGYSACFSLLFAFAANYIINKA